MIKKYITEIHTKSEEHRKRFTYIASGVLTLMIGVIWFSAYGLGDLARTGQNPDDAPKTYVATNDKPAAAPFKILGANISDAFNSFKSSVGLEKKKADQPSLEYVPDR